MSDLSDDEIKSIERSLGGPANVFASRSETCRMLAELVRRRAQPVITADRVREVVREAVVVEYGRPTHAEESDESALARRVAIRAAEKLAGSVLADRDSAQAECEQLRETLDVAARDHLARLDRLRALLVEPVVSEERANEIARTHIASGWGEAFVVHDLIGAARQLHSLLAALRRILGEPDHA